MLCINNTFCKVAKLFKDRCQNSETSPLKSITKLKMNKIVKRDKTAENERKRSKKEKENRKRKDKDKKEIKTQLKPWWDI